MLFRLIPTAIIVVLLIPLIKWGIRKWNEEPNSKKDKVEEYIAEMENTIEVAELVPDMETRKKFSQAKNKINSLKEDTSNKENINESLGEKK